MQVKFEKYKQDQRLLQCQCSGCDQETFGGVDMLVTLIVVMVSQCMYMSKLINMYL